MAEGTTVILTILGAYGVVNLWLVSEQLRNSKQIAVLQATVDRLSQDVRTFLKTETDVLTKLFERTQK